MDSTDLSNCFLGLSTSNKVGIITSVLLGLPLNGLMLFKVCRHKLSNTRYRQLLVFIFSNSIAVIITRVLLFTDCIRGRDMYQEVTEIFYGLSFNLEIFLMTLMLIYWKVQFRALKRADKFIFSVVIVSNMVLLFGCDSIPSIIQVYNFDYVSFIL